MSTICLTIARTLDRVRPHADILEVSFAKPESTAEEFDELFQIDEESRIPCQRFIIHITLPEEKTNE